MVAKLLICPSVVQDMVWGALNKHPMRSLLVDDSQVERITLDLYLAAVRSFFKSVPNKVYETPVDVLSRHLKRNELFEYGVSIGRFAVELVRVFDKENALGTVGFHDVVNYPPLHEIVNEVFYEAIEEIRHKAILNIAGSLKEKVDLRYRLIEFDVFTDRRGRIRIITILVGDDVRHEFFKSIFRDGKYDPMVLEKLNLPPLDTGFRYDRYSGMASFKSEG